MSVEETCRLLKAAADGDETHGMTVNTADVLKKDLAEAGIPYEDELGRVFDFHSLRGQCATLLALRGVHPKIAQSILRHSDINLTMNVYTRTDQAQKASAVTGLSDLFGATETPISEPKTGTDD